MWLKVEPDLERRYRVSWNGRRPYRHALSVDSGDIRRLADKTRNLLDSLSDWSQATNPSYRHNCLAKLAKAGSQLRYHLFNDQDNKKHVDGFEAWLKAWGDQELLIYADSSVQVPWGLIYDGVPPPADIGPEDSNDDSTFAEREIKRFSGFWALKYNLSATPCVSDLTPESMRRPRASFGLLSLLNEDLQKDVERDLGHDDYGRYCELLSPPVGVAYDIQKFQELIKSGQRDILFHFFGHHKNASLILANEEVIDYSDFLIMMEGLQDKEGDGTHRCGLLFLNGCESAIGDDDINLRALSRRPEICGVIGTEATVRTSYAAKFGYRFLRAMLHEGKTIAETMLELHHDPLLWPESLSYGCYAQPDYQIERSALEDVGTSRAAVQTGPT